MHPTSADIGRYPVCSQPLAFPGQVLHGTTVTGAFKAEDHVSYKKISLMISRSLSRFICFKSPDSWLPFRFDSVFRHSCALPGLSGPTLLLYARF